MSLAASELVKFFEPWTILAGAPAERLIMQLAFGVLLIGVIVVILLRWQRIDDTLFEALEERDDSRRRVIESIRRLRPVLDEAVGRIREIGEQIKILAINAAVQAVKAGEYGAGFRVVASELRSMIGSTDENLTRSRKLLDSIRSRARDNVAAVEKSTEVLRAHFDALTATAGLVGEMAESFVETADRVGRIAESSRRQESSIDEVSTAVDQISTAAGQLEKSGGTLLEIVRRITDAHRDLESALTSDR